MAYHHRRTNRPGSRATFEAVVTAIVLILVVATLVVFLFIFHDLPFRVA